MNATSAVWTIIGGGDIQTLFTLRWWDAKHQAVAPVIVLAPTKLRATS